MIGFGSVLGASLLVGLAVFIISKLQVIPVLGDYLKDILQEIDRDQVFEEEEE